MAEEPSTVVQMPDEERLGGCSHGDRRVSEFGSSTVSVGPFEKNDQQKIILVESTVRGRQGRRI